jgi:hypothetical protein
LASLQLLELVILYSNVLLEIQTAYIHQHSHQRPTLDTMLNDPKVFNTNILTGDLSLFAPLLQEDLTKLPPPFIITKPLHMSDFPKKDEDDTHNSFLTELEFLIEYFEQGYNDAPERDLALTIMSSQFIRRATQLITAIMAGIRITFPLSDSPQFL